MSIETLVAEIHLAQDRQNIDVYVASAALNDFLRSLHEVFTKSGRDQVNMLSQLQVVLGSISAHHLRRVISTESLDISNYPENKNCPLSDAVITLCRTRGVALDNGKALFRHFFKALDEERFDRDGNCQSAMFITYWAAGDEAAYHLGGLFVGDDRGVVSTEMEYLDYRLKRFWTLVERWEMELKWDREDQE